MSVRAIVVVAVLLIPVLVPLSVGASSQCDAVLRDGVMSRREWQNSEYARLVLAARFSKMSYQEAREHVKAGGTIPIEGIPVGGNFSQDRFNRWKEQVRQRLDVEQVINNQSSVLLTSGDPAILQAWSACISQSGGLTVFLEPRGDREAVLKMEWSPFPGTSTNPEITAFSVSGAQVYGDDQYTQRGSKLGFRTPRVVPLRRPAGGAIFVTVNTELGGRDAYLPAKFIPPPPPPRVTINIPVTQMTRGVGVEVGGGLSRDFGDDVLHNAFPYNVPRPNTAEFDFEVEEGGKYRLDIQYAALQSRSVEIRVNGIVVAGAGLSRTTDGWGLADQKWLKQVEEVQLRRGRNTLRLHRPDVFPHIRAIRFVPIP